MDNKLVDENKKSEITNNFDEKNKTDVDSLNLENLEGISGGYVFNGKEQTPEKNLPWEVIDKSGNVIERCATKESCIALAKKVLGESTRELNWEQVQFLRRTRGNTSWLERHITLNALDKVND